MTLAVSECIGCGFCCTKTLCDVARRVYSTIYTPCPALVWTGERHVCKLMTLPSRLGETYRQELYAGEGCCSGLNSWRREPLIDRTSVSNAPVSTHSNPIPEMLQIFISSLAKEFMSSDKITLILRRFATDMSSRGYSEEAVEVIVTRCVELFNNQRSSFMSKFMG